MEKPYTGYLYVSTKDGGMRVTKQRQQPKVDEVRIQVNITVDKPERVEHVLNARVIVPTDQVLQVEIGDPAGDLAGFIVEEG